jgi:hypothetical protein
VGLFGEGEQRILKNLIALGVSYDSSVVKSTKTVTKDQQKIANKRMETTSMQLNRYTSIVELVIPLFCQVLETSSQAKSIDKEVFGEVRCEVFSGEGEKGIRFKRDRFAVCMIGGMSWAEVSAIRSMENLENVVLMADSMMTVGDFFEEIGKINIIN